ncbi:hypothetical protein D1610_12835 [Sphingomonas gilva]|uniref:Uncharacterized protein n=1 Tax=Sphingomonas gilva TaxID=2305907 RepID=A0A396RL23_9SPHN|nr:hypothetical protein D1610_12835 [Sphingomonas gilva]
MRPPANVEKSLGFHAGRLSQGYFILLLKEQLKPGDIQMDGTTLRSGGKFGLPTGDKASDATRPRVHDSIDPAMLAHHQKGMSGDATVLRGINRLSKILPVMPHSDNMAPRDQYPMGGGGGQWTLKAAYAFLVAAYVGPDAIAQTIPQVGITASLAEGASYDARARLMRYLETA